MTNLMERLRVAVVGRSRLLDETRAELDTTRHELEQSRNAYKTTHAETVTLKNQRDTLARKLEEAQTEIKNLEAQRAEAHQELADWRRLAAELLDQAAATGGGGEK